RVFQSDGKEVKLTLTGYFWRYGIRKAIQVSIFRMNLIKSLCGSFCIMCLHPLTRRYVHKMDCRYG
ncbi:hypothetical protein ABMY10_24040, partial [Vibrio vulnificus]